MLECLALLPDDPNILMLNFMHLVLELSTGCVRTRLRASRAKVARPSVVGAADPDADHLCGPKMVNFAVDPCLREHKPPIVAWMRWQLGVTVGSSCRLDIRDSVPTGASSF